MYLKEYYKQELYNRLNESELAAAARDNRPPRKDLVLHQAARARRVLARMNRILYNNPQSSEPTQRSDMFNYPDPEIKGVYGIYPSATPQEILAHRLSNLATMTGLGTEVRTYDRTSQQRGGPMYSQHLELQQTPSHLGFGDLGMSRNVQPDDFATRVGVMGGENAMRWAQQAQDRNRRERTTRIGAIRSSAAAHAAAAAAKAFADSRVNRTIGDV